MSCKDCPYTYLESNIIKENYPKYAADYNYWCDKVGGRIWCCGICDEEEDAMPSSNKSKQKHRTKRERDYKYKQHLKYLSENCQWYPSPSYPVDKHGNYAWDESDIAYYKRGYKDNRRTGMYRYYKHYANRKVRRYKGAINNGCAYKKCFDLWWTIY